MDESAKFLIRLAPLLLIVVLLQLAVVTQFSVFGVAPDLLPLLVAAVGLLAGSTTGAIAGFLAGMLVDMALIQQLGVSSLLLTVIGYYTGRLREQYDPVNRLVPALVGAAAGAFFVIGFAVMQFSLGSSPPSGWGIVVQILMTALLSLLLAWPIFTLTRRALLDTLGMPDPVARRRKAVTVPYSFQPGRERSPTRGRRK